MRTHLTPLFFALALLAAPAAIAGEDYIEGCAISVSTTAASTGSDQDCVWEAGTKLKMWCDTAVTYDKKSGGTATAADPLVAVGDPYLLTLTDKEKDISVRAVAGTGTCYFGRDTKR